MSEIESADRRVKLTARQERKAIVLALYDLLRRRFGSRQVSGLSRGAVFVSGVYFDLVISPCEGRLRFQSELRGVKLWSVSMANPNWVDALVKNVDSFLKADAEIALRATAGKEEVI